MNLRFEFAYLLLLSGGLLVAFAVILLFVIRRMRRIEIDLTDRNKEAMALYVQLADSEEELRQSYEELMVNQRLLVAGRDRMKLSFESANDILWDWNIQTGDITISERFRRLAGAEFKSFKEVDRYLKKMIVPEDYHDKLLIGLSEHFARKTTLFQQDVRIPSRRLEYRWFSIRGRAMFDETGQPSYMAGSVTDITNIRRHQNELKKLAYTDSLTGLANRTHFRELFEKTVSAFPAGSSAFCALLYIDLDDFKLINDSHGHTLGDKILVELSQRLRSVVPASSVLARLGGDEFVILLTDTETMQSLNQYANAVLNALEAPVTGESHAFYVSASMGISLIPDHGITFEDVLKNADTAMYRAKYSGKRNYALFDRSMNDDIIQKLQLEHDLREALSRDEFIIHYQPQIDVISGSITGLEALVRWNRHDGTIVSPATFIPLAEDTGLISPLGYLVLDKACRFGRHLAEARDIQVVMSVNVSARQLMEDGFVTQVRQTIARTGFNPEYLELEITETALMNQFEIITARLRDLKSDGIKISLDDFGSGYSSLNYLRHLPINTLKIDKSFVDDLFKGHDFEIITTIIALAHSLKLKVIAEGVETQSQYDYLTRSHCDMIQGYYISKPLNEDRVTELLVSRERVQQGAEASF